MAEKIYPAAKPSGAPPPAATTGNPTFPANKAQLYNNSRPVYRPQPCRSRRSCCCCFCLWITFAIIVLIVIAAIVFYYDLVSVSFDSNGVNVGDGTISAFEMKKKKNTMSLRTVVTASGQSVDDNNLKSDLKNKKSVPLKIQLDTKVKAKIGSFKTKRLPIRTTCDGIKAVAPAGKTDLDI
ncbi:putative Late embryogenesis abundant protein, LEA_2 subgroup [Helianthus debilis subsp. tardiflorus]